MMGSMLVQALYNIVDSVFVAKLSENALTAVSLAFPIQTLLIALGTGTGVGVNSLLSKQLGEGDLKQVSKTAMNGIFLGGHELSCVCDCGNCGRQALLCKSGEGRRPGNYVVWNTVSDDCVRVFVWPVCTADL